jgi:hypothetical protein
MELNRTNASGSNDMVVATTVEAGGTLQVNNLGPDLHTGDTFQLFSVPVTGAFSVTNLPVTTGNGQITYVWTNLLAVNGTIQVLIGVPNINTNPVPITFTVSGNVLNLSWPSDHEGWQLYTNAVGLTAMGSWFPMPGSANVTTETVAIDPTKTNVFYQLRYP